MRLTSFTTTVTAIALAASIAYAQGAYKRELPDSLKSQAKIAEHDAAKTALAKVPKGTIEGVELEKEHGKLIYSYDIKVPGKSGIEEVHVDAVTGEYLSREHETASAEKKEAAEEAKEAKGKAAPAKPEKP